MKYLILATGLFLVGCESRDIPINGIYVKDAGGNIYRLEHRVGDLFLVQDVDQRFPKQIQELIDK